MAKKLTTSRHKVELYIIPWNFKQMFFTVYMYFMALMDDLYGCLWMYSVQTTLLNDQTRIPWLLYSFI